MKRVLILSFVFLIILTVVAFFTKTTQQEFTDVALEKWKQYSAQFSSDPVMEDVVALQNDFMLKALNRLVKSDDYVLFSKFTLQLADGEYEYIGVFHQVIPLQAANPITQFYPNDEQ